LSKAQIELALPKKITILGMGLIGGSFALAMKQQPGVEITGFDRDEVSLVTARHLGVVDVVAKDMAQAVHKADLILLAVPVGQIPVVLKELAPHLAAHTLITDVGSTKGSVVSAAREILGDAFARFIPAHPIAGAEQSGVRFARADLFQNKAVILTPEPTHHPLPIKRVVACWSHCGARVEEMDAQNHDHIFGLVSHLPHLLSFALVHDIALRDDAQRLFHYAASGFRDFTRIAASSPEMWKDISLANREVLMDEVAHYRDSLGQMLEWLKNSDADALEQFMKVSREARRRWSESHSPQEDH
jgi:prephenate dehydrogenase